MKEHGLHSLGLGQGQAVDSFEHGKDPFFPYNVKISYPAEDLLAPQGGLCSMQLVTASLLAIIHHIIGNHKIHVVLHQNMLTTQVKQISL
jgi:hypothetical protein